MGQEKQTAPADRKSHGIPSSGSFWVRSKANPGANPHPLLYLELPHVLGPCEAAAPHQQQYNECLNAVTAHVGQYDHLVRLDTDLEGPGHLLLLGYKLTIVKESLVEGPPLTPHH